MITSEIIERITKVDSSEFPTVLRVSLKHDCSVDSLQLFGETLPNLREINLNGSLVGCLRDIGTSMSNLRVLFLSRVKLRDLAGFNAFPQLSEFYASYNQITELTELYFHENLEVLDVEGNDIANAEALEVLETIPKLKVLNISHNIIFYEAQTVLMKKIPQLEVLNDVPTKDIITRAEESNRTQPSREEDIYHSLKQLNWGGEKLLSEDIVAQLNVELRNELTEENLLIFSVKKTAAKTMKRQQAADNPITPNLMRNTSSAFFTNAMRQSSIGFRPQTPATAASVSENALSAITFNQKQPNK